MMVPSRSTKTAGDSALVIFAVLSETGDKFVSCHGRCSKFTDYNCAPVVGDFRRFNRSRSTDEPKTEESDGRVAGARDIKDLPCLRRDVMRRFLLFFVHDTASTESDK